MPPHTMFLGGMSEIMSLESLKPFRIPKQNTRQCHKGQRKDFLLIESRQQHDSSKTTHDAHQGSSISVISDMVMIRLLLGGPKRAGGVI